jgi:hypothetical protein
MMSRRLAAELMNAREPSLGGAKGAVRVSWCEVALCSRANSVRQLSTVGGPRGRTQALASLSQTNLILMHPAFSKIQTKNDRVGRRRQALRCAESPNTRARAAGKGSATWPAWRSGAPRSLEIKPARLASPPVKRWM